MRRRFRHLHHIHVLSASLTAIALGSGAALAQNGLPFRVEAPPGSVFFGGSVASGGDADGDGFDDVFIMDHEYEEGGVVLGRSFMYSGRTGREMWRVTGAQAIRAHWYLVGAFIGDIDGDGGDDIALGQPSAGEKDQGRVDVYSGRSGALLHSFIGEVDKGQTGRDVAGLGDVDRDGTPDFAFISRCDVDGRTSIRSGRDGSEILSLARQWPRCVRGAGDINGDGRADIAVGSWNISLRGLGVGVYSGADGSIIYDLARRHLDDDFFGWTLAAGHDLTGDDIPDVIASGGASYADRPFVYLIDGGTGVASALRLPAELGAGGLFGYTTHLGDVNGDGTVEAVIGDLRGHFVFDAASGRVLSTSPPSRLGRGGVFGIELVLGDVNGDGFADVITQHGTDAVVARAGAPILVSPEIPNFRRRGIIELVAHHGTPDRRLYFLGSRKNAACTFIPRLDLCLNLARPFALAGFADTDTSGVARLRVDLFSAPLGNLWFQVVDPNDPQRGAIVSNLLEIEAVE